MPQPNDGGNAETIEEPKAPVIDAFGQAELAEPPKKEETEDKEKKEDKKTKEFAAIPEDHPTVVALKAEIEKVKNEYGTNLSGQRTVIATLEGKIDALLKGGAHKEENGEVDVLFKDIKHSKDLTKEQRDEMTDTEIRQMDEIADMKEAQNKMYAEQQKALKAGTKVQETTKVENLNSLVQTFAKDLAKNEDGTENTQLANEIIESTKQFNLEGLDAETVKQRVISAHKLLPSYTPPKEQPKKNGKPVTNTKSTDEDPFGVNKIVEEAGKGGDGTYAL